MPTPISVLGAETLETQRIYRVQDLQQLVPSTNVAYVHARQSSISIRGLGNNPASDGLEGSVGVYLDNVYLGRPGMAVFDLLDVEQLEVLRGPQGTLFGKNTTAGVLNITSRKPTFTTERSLQSSVGEDGYWQTQGSVSGGLTETLAGRLSAYRTEDDGYVKNLYNGDDLNGGKRQGFRGQLLFEPSETFNLRWIGEYNEEDSNNGILSLYSTGPTINGVNRYEQRAAAAGATLVSGKDRKVNFDSDQQVTVFQGGTSVEANWTLPNDFTLTSISAYRWWDFTRATTTASTYRRRSTPASRCATSSTPRKSAWPRPRATPSTTCWAPTTSSRTWITTPSPTTGPRPTSGTARPPAPGQCHHPGRRPHRHRQLRAVRPGHLAPHRAPGLHRRHPGHLRGEGRLGRALRPHRRRGSQRRGGHRAPGPGRGLRLGRPQPAQLQPLRPARPELPDQPRPARLRLAVPRREIRRHQPHRGQRPTAGADSLLVGTERANNAEIGFKSTLLDRTLLLNANLFWTEVHGYQANAYDEGTRTSYLTNAGSVRSRGLEVETTWQPVRGLTLNANGSWNDVRYLAYKDAPCAPEVGFAPARRPPATSPGTRW